MSSGAAAPGEVGEPSEGGLFGGLHPALELLRSAPWEASSLGPVDGWDPSLRFLVRSLLPAPVPLIVWWGPTLIQIPNVAAVPLLEPSAPVAAVPAARCWPLAWERLAALLERARAGALFDPAMTVPAPVDTRWILGASPIRGEGGSVDGVLGTFTDVTKGAAGLAAVTTQNEQLVAALRTNRRIGAAIGIVMSRRRLSEDAAFELLSRTSQVGNRKIRELAEEVLFIGDLPGSAR